MLSGKINFVLPFIPTKPVGGAKIMFEYANRLAAQGHQVTILYSIERPFKKSKTPVWVRFLLQYIRKVKWFEFEPNIKQKLVTRISNRTVPDATATVSTWWQMAYSLDKLGASKGKKINLIQDYEIWAGNEDKVRESYKLNLSHVVIAKYLSKLVLEVSGREPIHVPNSIDLEVFKITNSITQRDPKSVIMMFSNEERKGSKYGLEALNKVKEQIYDLTVTLFSVYDRPSYIPSWMNFIKRPPNLADLYNQHAIFVTPSLGEGWALPPAEAMACGCAVVCTSIGGHQDYARDSETALVVPPANIEAMVLKILTLIKDSAERCELATRANMYIHQFQWDNSVAKLKSVITD